MIVFVCFVALRPKSTAMVIAGRSVHLSTLYPLFKINLHEGMGPGRDRTRKKRAILSVVYSPYLTLFFIPIT